MKNFRLQIPLSSRHHFFSKSLIWSEKIGSRDPVIQARAVAPGSRLAPFSTPVPVGLGKMGGRDDSAGFAEMLYPKSNQIHIPGKEKSQ